MGIGALVATAPMDDPCFTGGQERSVRSGTIDAPAIAGFAEAAVHSKFQHLDEESARIAALRNDCCGNCLRLSRSAPERRETHAHREYRVRSDCPATPSPSKTPRHLLFLLDMQGISNSAGSACNAGVTPPLHVLMAMGMDEHRP